MIGRCVNSTYQPGWVIADGQEDGFPGEIEVSMESGSGDYDVEAPYKVNDGNWHHLVMTADLINDFFVVYIDGVLMTSYYYKAAVRWTRPVSFPPLLRAMGP